MQKTLRKPQHGEPSKTEVLNTTPLSISSVIVLSCYPTITWITWITEDNMDNSTHLYFVTIFPNLNTHTIYEI